MKKPFIFLRLNIITIVVTIFLIISCLFNYFLSRNMQSCYEEQEELIFNGNQLMAGSTKLTNDVRAYATTGDLLYYDEYWKEVNDLKSRNLALARMKEIGMADDELYAISEMTRISDKLILRESVAMNDVKNGDFGAAVDYLYGDEYISTIDTIMKHKEGLMVMICSRTDAEIDNITLKSNILQITLCFFTLLVVFLQILNYIKNKKTLHEVDSFSGIYNRTKYGKFLKQVISDKPDAVGIISLDINGLKQVNDKYGYEYGDKLILKVVSMMKIYFKDNLFRVGGDEFVVLVVDMDNTDFEEKVLRLRSMSEIDGIVSVSIGSVWCKDVSDVLRHIAYADELMLLDKNNYNEKYQLKGTGVRVVVVADLEKSIAMNEFFIVLQPKFDLIDKRIVGAEALVRKRDKEGRTIPPDKFISVYESDGVIAILDFFVLETVCIMLKGWKSDGYTLLPISVNFSRISILEHNVADKMNALCQKHGIEPKFITVELTEHMGENIPVEKLNEILKRIKEFGFCISLDDFGREYANLSILSTIAFDEIKLDKSLIDDIATNSSTSTATRCIIEMCNAYRPTQVVVEGIETHGQVAKLKELNCVLPIVQGYYFSKPIEVERFQKDYLSV